MWASRFPVFSMAVFDRILSCSRCGFWVKKSIGTKSVWMGRSVQGSHLFMLGSHLEPLLSSRYQFQHQHPHFLQLMSPSFSAASFFSLSHLITSLLVDTWLPEWSASRAEQGSSSVHGGPLRVSTVPHTSPGCLLDHGRARYADFGL
jgi:hypothetical protein